MRIAMVGNFGLTGKQTMTARALPLAEALVGRGHEVLLALPVRRQADRGGPRQRNGVRLRYASRISWLPPLSYLWQAAVLAVHCLRWQPEVLYTFKPIAHAWAVLAIFRALRRFGLFRGAIALDTDDWEGEGGWNDRQPFSRWLKALIAWQEIWSLRRADVVTVASRALVGLAEGVGARRVVYVPNALGGSGPPSPAPWTGQRAGPRPTGGKGDGGHPGSGPLRAKLGLQGRAVVLLYTRFVEFEVVRLLDVFEGILRHEDSAALLVVGAGLEGEERKLERLAVERQMGGKVVVAGWVAPERLPEYFGAADVALYPMDDTLLNRTKCPVKLLELLAAGVPVVADRVGQAAEYVADGRTGVLVRPGDARAMAEAAASLLADLERRRAVGEAARADVRARWTWNVWAPVVENALLAHSASPRRFRLSP